MLARLGVCCGKKFKEGSHVGAAAPMNELFGMIFILPHSEASNGMPPIKPIWLGIVMFIPIGRINWFANKFEAASAC